MAHLCCHVTQWTEPFRFTSVGVRMAKGEEIRAPSIISGCGVFNTYKRLLPPQVRFQSRYEGSIKCFVYCVTARKESI